MPKVLAAMILFALTMMSTASLAVPDFSSGKLTAVPLGTGQCPGMIAAIQGEQIQITGSGFDPGTSIDLLFRCCEDFETSLGSVNADGSGGLDTTVTIPSGYAVVADGELLAIGPAPVADTLRMLSVDIWIGPASVADGDSDGFSDFCDNCPAIGNPGQEDYDTDDIGDVCDSCAFDLRNDADGDGLCADADSCPFDSNNDNDGDTICGNEDNCPNDSNFFQEDSDDNGIGDACQLSPTCSDGVDNDNDGRTDFPHDKGCDDADDTTETSALLPCDDGIDNDSDGLIDFKSNLTRDPGCGYDTAAALPENPQCNDGIDNDGDGLIDWDGDFGLTAPDPKCQGFGFGSTEFVPEPGFGLGMSAGVAFLAAIGRHRSRIAIRKSVG